MIKRALVDGDILVYRVGFSCQTKGVVVDPLDIAYQRIDVLMDKIMDFTKATDYTIYLSGEDNFRLEFNPEYKANRDPTAKPEYYSDLKNYLLERWKAVVTQGEEADDAMGIAQCQNEGTVICTIDKDLRMIPGHHFNFVRDELGVEYVDPFEGIKSFYHQLLTGDTVDNVIGLDRIGPRTADKILRFCETEEEMFETVRERYNNDERMLMNGICLWIRRKPGEIWKFPDIVRDNGPENNEKESAGEESEDDSTFFSPSFG